MKYAIEKGRIKSKVVKHPEGAPHIAGINPEMMNEIMDSARRRYSYTDEARTFHFKAPNGDIYLLVPSVKISWVKAAGGAEKNLNPEDCIDVM